MKTELRCTKVLVTGGGSGIGKAIAKRLIEGGAKVVIAGRTLEKLKEAQQEIQSPDLFILPWDVSDLSVCMANLERAAEMMGGLDGVVNNAAIGTNTLTGRGFEPWDITEAEWDTLMNTNLKAVFFMMRNTIDYMRQRGIRGNILNISSNAAYMDIIGSYGIAKLGIMRMTRAFGKRFGADGIIINGIAPAATYTPIISYYAHDIDQPYPRHALGRFIRPEEIAELAAYLMSTAGEIICGDTIVADAGDKNTAY